MSIKTPFIAYIGTYTTGDSEGIYSFSFDPNTGNMDNLRLAAEIEGPTYLAISKNNEFAYSVAKVNSNGGVASFSINEDQSLTFLNAQVEEGSAPCHVSIYEEQGLLFSANYHKGSANVFPIKNGELLEATSTVIHQGSGPNKDRQTHAHAHFAGITPDQNFVCVVDLGKDTIAVYTLRNQELSLHKEITVTPGSGPRHIRFHPNGKFAYVNAELSSELLVFEYDGTRGDFKQIQSISTLPEEFTGESTGGALHLSTDGRFIYASNRGHDSIAVFQIDEKSGQVTLHSLTSTAGSHPRDFTIDPTGHFIIAANKDSNNLVLFSRDQDTGALSKTDQEITVPNPVCVKFLHVN